MPFSPTILSTYRRCVLRNSVCASANSQRGKPVLFSRVSQHGIDGEIGIDRGPEGAARNVVAGFDRPDKMINLR